MSTLKHKAINMISQLKVNGRTIDDEDSIRKTALEFFSNLLTKDQNLDLQA